MRRHCQQSHRLVASGLAAATFCASAALAQTADVGLSSVDGQRFGRESLSDPNATGGDQYGSAFAVGDFDGDGADDLATGAPANDGPSGAPVNGCGAVLVRYGVVGKGLDNVAPPTVLNGGFPEVSDQFGRALTACNLNGDLYDDLVVGVPWESVVYGFDLEAIHAGIVEVYYGTSAGIVSPANTTRRETGDEVSFPPAETYFGLALACGDFNLDGFDDLAVGLPHRDLGSAINAGRVNIYAGSISGISSGALKLDQNSADIFDSPESGDLFGLVLAVGKFDDDGFDDLAIGVPGEDNDGDDIAPGAVHVIYGGDTGLASGIDQLFFATGLGRPDQEEAFGQALAAGDFDADSYDDLAIGVSGANVSTRENAGIVLEVFGAAAGLDASHVEVIDQDLLFGSGAAAEPEHFGTALAAGDFDGDKVDDLAIGAPFEDVQSNENGTVSIVMGLAGTGLDPTPNRSRQIRSGLQGFPGDANEVEVRLGDELAVGDFDGNEHADLAIGAPNEWESGLEDVGSVTVVYGALFADGFGTGGMGMWSDVVPHN